MDYIVEVTSTFETEDGEDSLSICCPAMYRFTPERRLIRYDEFTDEGVCMHVRVVSTAEGVDIIREGNRALDLKLRPGKYFSQEYNVGYGVIPLEYTARHIEDCLGEDGGTLTVKYKIDIGGVGSFNSVTMKVRKTDPSV